MSDTATIAAGQKVAADVSALLRARNPLLWVVTREEARVERYLIEAAGKAGYVSRTWDSAQGVLEINGKPNPQLSGVELRNADVLLDLIKTRTTTGNERCAWILRDFHAWLEGPAGIGQLRQLRNLARLLPGVGRPTAQAIIILSPKSQIPEELAGHATVIDWPLPDRIEIGAILDAAIAGLPEDKRSNAAPNGTRDAAIDAAIGLTGEEAANCYAKSLVLTKTIDPSTVSKEKKRVIARERVLEWFDPLPGGLDAVGGLDLLKGWLASRSKAYSKEARAYGLPAPKGALLVGPPGTGKSHTAKAIATAWKVPLLRLDLGALKSKFVGESEGNLRKALKVVEAIGRCVLWIDEIEKALGGAINGAADGGVSADALGAVLTWMSERQGGAFVIATANDVEKLPPELLRKGRFDERWFIDLPTSTEREAVLATALVANGRRDVEIDLAAVAAVTRNYTGAEIAALVPDALYAAFAQDAREIVTDDLIKATDGVVPQADSIADKLQKLRDWAKTGARRASSEAATETASYDKGRAIDL